MSHYIHHVPGRLRVRFKAFRHPLKTQTIAKQLETLTGVQEVRINPHANSITVHYNPAHITQTDLLALLEKAGCPTMSKSNHETAGQMGEMFGKALFGAVVQKTVERSVQSLVGVFL
jgi:copper chaperone CopZ